MQGRESLYRLSLLNRLPKINADRVNLHGTPPVHHLYPRGAERRTMPVLLRLFASFVLTEASHPSRISTDKRAREKEL